jgi:hypothetical protein
VRLADAAGARSFKLQDSAAATVWEVNSNGDMTVYGTMTMNGALVLPTSASPSLTTEGSIAFDTDDNTIKVYDGSVTKEWGYLGTTTPAAVGAVAAAGTSKETSRVDHVHAGGSRGLFLTGRRKYLEFSGASTVTMFDGAAQNDRAIGVGVGMGQTQGTATLVYTTSIVTAATVTDGGVTLETSASANYGVYIGTVSDPAATSTAAAILAPDKSPSMLLDWTTPPSNAALTACNAGFFSDNFVNIATANGAYLRRTTTGNLIFVTRQGGTETPTDLGALAATRKQYIIETTDLGVTWLLIDASTGSTLATHTTNVPTVTTDLFAGLAFRNNTTTNLTLNLYYMSVEAKY